MKTWLLLVWARGATCPIPFTFHAASLVDAAMRLQCEFTTDAMADVVRVDIYQIPRT